MLRERTTEGRDGAATTATEGFVMLTSLRRRAASALAVGSAALLLGAAGASPASARPPQVDLVNLGDSFSAAIGTGAITASPDDPACLQGQGPDHVSKLDSHPRITLLLDAACSGLDSAGVGAVAALPPVAAALAEAELVTLTLGGNDVPWIPTILACSTFGDDQSCDGALGLAALAVAAAAASAGTTVDAIDAATDAKIVVLGYPHLVDPSAAGLPITPERAADLNAVTDQLNAALQASTEANGATFVDVTARFAGHGVGSDDPWIHLDLADLFDPNNLHPTSEGYLSGYHPAVMSAISIGQLGR
ncbi:GDSL-type esterase/lipase family protein [Georgenia subflava]|uniref:SGNH/GDSL hydrolase family protein n=1 Tax=Georgenia subflava TaxID=1622177 RepID=A0A6N7EQ46_9MICO|nr:GDSL-type esterase/lipase family protein [Georgenia subflava]MPV37334.1 SGNH/GDSL hydrolase family protein [Georgenia subflava]